MKGQYIKWIVCLLILLIIWYALPKVQHHDDHHPCTLKVGQSITMNQLLRNGIYELTVQPCHAIIRGGDKIIMVFGPRCDLCDGNRLTLSSGTLYMEDYCMNHHVIAWFDKRNAHRLELSDHGSLDVYDANGERLWTSY